ncbi:MAG: DUF4190 domain-containing protein [Polyangiaceae bacterium]|nr:DUF4190 domain-containing protein [Myxococcales bacterium]MCC6901686.1 DUF4190 domain-containing protein [Polyangiaceae bacterium]
MQPPPGPPWTPPGGAPPVPPGGPPPGGPVGFVPPPVGTWGAPIGPPPKPTDSNAVISLVLAIATMSTTCFPMGFAALYFGHKARQKAKEENDTGNNATLALVGMIMGGIFGGIWLLFWLLEAGLLIFGVGMAVFTRP